jgi:hypothetical protein
LFILIVVLDRCGNDCLAGRVREWRCRHSLP